MYHVASADNPEVGNEANKRNAKYYVKRYQLPSGTTSCNNHSFYRVDGNPPGDESGLVVHFAKKPSTFTLMSPQTGKAMELKTNHPCVYIDMAVNSVDDRKKIEAKKKKKKKKNQGSDGVSDWLGDLSLGSDEGDGKKPQNTKSSDM